MSNTAEIDDEVRDRFQIDAPEKKFEEYMDKKKKGKRDKGRKSNEEQKEQNQDKGNDPKTRKKMTREAKDPGTSEMNKKEAAAIYLEKAAAFLDTHNIPQYKPSGRALFEDLIGVSEERINEFMEPFINTLNKGFIQISAIHL